MTEAISIGPFSFIDSNSTVKQVKRKDVAWGRKDMLKYAIFLNYAALCELIPQENDNKWSFFCSLSIFLQNKNPNQCRILHLTMLKTHKSIENILSYFQAKQLNFLSLCKKFEPIIRNALHIIARERTKSSKITFLAYTINMIATLDFERRSGQKDKEQMKPTDTAYPQEKAEAIEMNLSLDQTKKVSENHRNPKLPYYQQMQVSNIIKTSCNAQKKLHILSNQNSNSH